MKKPERQNKNRFPNSESDFSHPENKQNSARQDGPAAAKPPRNFRNNKGAEEARRGHDEAEGEEERLDVRAEDEAPPAQKNLEPRKKVNALG